MKSLFCIDINRLNVYAPNNLVEKMNLWELVTQKSYEVAIGFFCRDLNMVEHGRDQFSSYWKIILEKEKLSWETLKISLGID